MFYSFGIDPENLVKKMLNSSKVIVSLFILVTIARYPVNMTTWWCVNESKIKGKIWSPHKI